MIKKRENDLKERLKALRVSEPLKLKRQWVGLRSPEVNLEATRSEEPPIRAPQSEAALGETSQIEVTSRELPPAVMKGQTLKNAEPQIAIPNIEGARVERAQTEAAQRGSPSLQQFEPPQTEELQAWAAPQGFFKLSHGVFGEPLLKNVSGDCFRLFLWLSSRAWRYPSSGGMVRASVGYIEAHAGMSHATISRGLKTLKEKGLISILEVNYKSGNLWQVSSLACGYPNHDDKPTRDKAPQNEATRYARAGTSENGSQSLEVRSLPPQNEHDLRSINKIKKNKKDSRRKIQLVMGPVNPEDAGAKSSSQESPSVLLSFEAEMSTTEQSTFITAFMEREFPHGFFPPMRVVKILAAKDWGRCSEAALLPLRANG